MRNSASRLRHLHLPLLAGLLVNLIASSIFAADPPTTTPTYEGLVSEYMTGRWGDLEIDLKVSARLRSALSTDQKADLDYIAKTLAECRPAWWKIAKAGKRTQVKASIFTIPVTAIYDPQQKQGMNVRFSEDSRQFTFGWESAEMDSTAEAEHGFTEGELSAGGIWSTLGMSAGYVQVPFQSLLNLSEADKIKLTRELDFRGNLAAAYYGNPRTRQWWFFLSLHYYRPQYQKSPIVMSRKALGVMFVDELLTHRSQYPSIELPGTLPTDSAEEKLVAAVHDQIERHGWTLSEDKLIRDATKAFALANASIMHTGGPVKLANGLQVSLDPEEDKPMQLQRDQWVSQQVGKN